MNRGNFYPFSWYWFNLYFSDEKYSKINPNKKVPCLQINGIDISESKVICDYLDKEYPDPPLYPKDQVDWVRTQEVWEYVNSSIQPLQNVAVLKKLNEEGNIDKLKWAQFFIHKGLSAISHRISEHRGKYTIGDNITMADVFLYPQLGHARNVYKLDIDNDFPDLAQIEKQLSTHPAFINASPKLQPDFPKKK